MTINNKSHFFEPSPEIPEEQKKEKNMYRCYFYHEDLGKIATVAIQMYTHSGHLV